MACFRESLFQVVGGLAIVLDDENLHGTSIRENRVGREISGSRRW
jgi:hypothetical protein